MQYLTLDDIEIDHITKNKKMYYFGTKVPIGYSCISLKSTKEVIMVLPKVVYDGYCVSSILRTLNAFYAQGQTDLRNELKTLLDI